MRTHIEHEAATGDTHQRFIGERIDVQFDKAPTFSKKPGCPHRFVWRGQTYRVIETLSEWKDYGRRGHMARTMSPVHALRAASRGSWGVGRFYFRVRVDTGQIFDLYYDRAPKKADDRKGAWFLFSEIGCFSPHQGLHVWGSGHAGT